MGWQVVVLGNVVIVGAYLAIAATILQGLVTTRQLRTNALAVATGLIFLTCALHHGHHALHLLTGTPQELRVLRAAFGTWHGVAVELVGVVVAVAYLMLRHTYGTLLNTPAMFEDQVKAATADALRRLAYTDALTGCGNRAAYDAHVDGLAGRDDAVTVVYLDLDDFKQVNDAFGHEAGDRVLREVGGRLASGMATGQRAFRLGGDEFVVVQVVPAGRRGEDAEALSARCRLLIGLPVTLREGDLRCQASGGAATGPAADGLQHLLRQADAAMYAAKAARPRLPRQRTGLDAPVGR